MELSESTTSSKASSETVYSISSAVAKKRVVTYCSVAQCDLSSLCMRTPMAQAPDEWLTALQRWATHSSAISADPQWGLRTFLLTPISWTKLSPAMTLLSMPVTFPINHK